MSTFAKIHRKIRTNFLWDSSREPFSKGQAWVDLILQAQYKDYSHRTKYGVVNLKPGEVYSSWSVLAESWGWNKSKVRRFIDDLVCRGMLEKRSAKASRCADIPSDIPSDTESDTPIGIVLTLLKYGDYNNSATHRATHYPTQVPTHLATPEQEYTEQEVNNSNNNNKSACAHTPASNLEVEQPTLSEFIHLVITDLNFLLDKNFNPYSAETARLISDRLEERWTIEQFYEVHRRWIIRLYGEDGFTGIRPDTLYNQDFEKRLNYPVTFSGNKVFITWTQEQRQEFSDFTKTPEGGDPWTWTGHKSQLFKAMIKSYSDWRNTLDSLQGRLESTCA